MPSSEVLNILLSAVQSQKGKLQTIDIELTGGGLISSHTACE